MAHSGERDRNAVRGRSHADPATVTFLEFIDSQRSAEIPERQRPGRFGGGRRPGGAGASCPRIPDGRTRRGGSGSLSDEVTPLFPVASRM